MTSSLLLTDMSKRSKQKPCDDCEKSTVELGEHYFVHKSIWDSVCTSERGFLCIGCLETRLGRNLQPKDFTDASINKPQRGKLMSNRLMTRMGLM